jgi:hypothetical protein
VDLIACGQHHRDRVVERRDLVLHGRLKILLSTRPQHGDLVITARAGGDHDIVRLCLCPAIYTPGRSAPENNTFNRESQPLFATGLVGDKIAQRQSRIGRASISPVQDHRANADRLDTARRVGTRRDVPTSALVSATLIDEAFLWP